MVSSNLKRVAEYHRRTALHSKWLLFIPPTVAGFDCPMTSDVVPHFVRLLAIAQAFMHHHTDCQQTFPQMKPRQALGRGHLNEGPRLLATMVLFRSLRARWPRWASAKSFSHCFTTYSATASCSLLWFPFNPNT